MAFYSAGNIEVKLNDAGVFARSVSLSTSVETEPIFEVGKSVTDNYIIKGGLGSELRLSYFVTGVDPLKTHMVSGSLPVSAYVGGLSLESGYLTNYSFSAEPYGAAEISATLKFFESPGGDFVSAPSSLDRDKVLLFSDFEFSEVGVINSHELLSLSYDYSREVNPIYSLQDTGEEVVVHGVREDRANISLNVQSNDLSVSLPETGLAGTATLEFKGRSGESTEKYYISGIISHQESEFGNDEIVSRSLKLSQSSLASPPSITSVSPVTAEAGDTVTISGENFIGVESVRLLDQEVEFAVTDLTDITFVVPSDAQSGTIEVHTKGGVDIYSNVLTVTVFTETAPTETLPTATPGGGESGPTPTPTDTEHSPTPTPTHPTDTEYTITEHTPTEETPTEATPTTTEVTQTHPTPTEPTMTQHTPTPSYLWYTYT